MSIESGRDKLRLLSPRENLTADCLNDWLHFRYWGDQILRGINKPFPIKLPRYYEQRYKDKESQGYSPEARVAIMNESNPESVAAYDKLVDEFTTEAKRIEIEKDGQAALDFFERAAKIVLK